MGVHSVGIDLPESVSNEELLKAVQDLNARKDIHGILVQLPLPKHINEEAILNAIEVEKDVDGLHPLNVAQLAKQGTRTGGVRIPDLCSDKCSVSPMVKRKLNLSILVSLQAKSQGYGFHVACTPQGCIELLQRSGVSIEGKEAVVIGRSNIVGIPMTLLLLRHNATVTVVHSRTKNAEEVIKRADIVVAAVGRAQMVKGEWLKPGAVVIDVGINAVDDASKKAGYRLVGDVDYESAKEVASQITPVPGGVGPMTIAMLLKNTVAGFERSLQRQGKDIPA